MTRDSRDVRASAREPTQGPACVCHALVMHTRAEDARVLGATLTRVLRSPRIAGVCLATTDEPLASRALEIAQGRDPRARARVRLAAITPDARSRHRGALIDAARAAGKSCWRGGIGNACVFDEAFDPSITLELLGSTPVDAGGHGACLIVDAGWRLLDPALCDALIERFGEDPESMRLAFSQSPPGLGACVIGSPLLGQLSAAARAASNATQVLNCTLGAMLGYNQHAPINDLIATARCVGVPAELRDVGVRLVGDTPGRLALLDRVNQICPDADARGLIRAIEQARAEMDPLSLIDEIVIPARSGRARGAMDEIDALLRAGARPLVTIGEADEGVPVGRELEGLIGCARERGLRVHVRTSLPSPERDADALIEMAPDIVSVDLYADTAETYRAMCGRDDFEHARSGVERLLSARAAPEGFDGRGLLLVVPRLMRCDAAYADVETFYHRWLHHAGWAVIDPPRAGREAGGIRPLTTPSHALRRLSRTRRVLGASPDGARATERET